MIIELFGPPGAGKTTFAQALTSHLRECGYVAGPIISYRPAERVLSGRACEGDAAGHHAKAILQRVSRPAGEALAMARHPLVLLNCVMAASEVVNILPPRNVTWKIRLVQYLSRLFWSWQCAAQTDQIVLFDQAFVQAVCSLVLLGSGGDKMSIGRALDAVPKGDLMVRLSAPNEILEERLRLRQSRQGAMERLFELDLKTNLDSVVIIDDLYDRLRRRGHSVTCISTYDMGSLAQSVEEVANLVIARVDGGRTGSVATERFGTRFAVNG